MNFKSAKQLFVVFTSLVAITLYFHSTNKNQTHTTRKALYNMQKEIVVLPLKSWPTENRTTNQSNGTFIVNKDEFGIPDNEPHLYLRSAYLDYRLNPPKAWVLAVAGKDLKTQNAQCFYYFKATGSKKERTEAITTSILSDIKSSCFFRVLILQCDLGKDKPDYVTITFNDKARTLWLASRSIGKNKIWNNTGKNLGLCLKTLFDLTDDSIPNIVSFMEMQRLLGVDQVILYDIINSTATYDALFKYYQDQGFMKIVSWKFDGVRRYDLADERSRKAQQRKDLGLKILPGARSLHQKILPALAFVLDGKKYNWCVPIYAQNILNSDCVLRNIGQFKYLAFHDDDEIILPKKHDNLTHLLQELDSGYHPTNSFVFSEQHFCPDIQNKGSMRVASTKRLDAQIKGHTKYIARPALVRHAEVHSLSGAIGGKVNYVESSIANVHHYRIPSYCGNLMDRGAATYLRNSSNGALTDDFTAVRYFKVLSQRLQNVATAMKDVLPSNIIQQLKDSTYDLIEAKL